MKRERKRRIRMVQRVGESFSDGGEEFKARRLCNRRRDWGRRELRMAGGGRNGEIEERSLHSAAPRAKMRRAGKAGPLRDDKFLKFREQRARGGGYTVNEASF